MGRHEGLSTGTRRHLGPVKPLVRNTFRHRPTPPGKELTTRRSRVRIPPPLRPETLAPFAELAALVGHVIAAPSSAGERSRDTASRCFGDFRCVDHQRSPAARSRGAPGSSGNPSTALLVVSRSEAFHPGQLNLRIRTIIGCAQRSQLRHARLLRDQVRTIIGRAQRSQPRHARLLRDQV